MHEITNKACAGKRAAILCRTGPIIERGINIVLFFISPRREWAIPGGTAIPGRPAEELEQAPVSLPSSKNQFNIEVPQWGTYQILS